ncbi:MAG: hypothetical protein IJ456_07190 [Bacteroides sp.]|nr:hypothetical protein [Bacteroides sp.]
MNELKDNGLKKALRAQPEFHLPTNFTFRTMRKVELEALRLEKKRERMTLLAVIGASLLLLTGSGITLWMFFGDTIEGLFAEMAWKELPTVSFPPFFYFVMGCIPLFVCFDHWMRKQYYKRHPEDSLDC